MLPLNALATALLTAGFVFYQTAPAYPAHRALHGVGIRGLLCLSRHLRPSQDFDAGVHTPFGGEGAIRTIYYTMLISHIILAMVIVPLECW